MAKFVCQAGPDAGHEYPINEARTVFGRRSGCQVQIMDSMASREHFEVRKVGQLYTLVDLESRNGTKVNDRKVTERQLDFNDRVRVGEVEWLFVKEEGDVELKDLLTSKYEIIEKIGEGGMGVVYKALQRSMDRTVALKVLAPKYAARPKFVQRFIDEARAAGRLNHPNIIQVHDVDTENGIHYFSMEHIDGGTCSQLLKANGPFDPDQALEITRLTAKALAYAHENRLIHRDVKPDNIMVSSSNMVKLADLGISKSFDEAESEERPKKIIGTPHYMAPEAVQGKKIDHRIDIYSLGATLFHLLSGETPFRGKSPTEVFKAHVNQEPPSLIDLRPGLPPEVCELVESMMAKDPDQRPETVTELLTEIEKVQEDCGLAANLPSTGDTVMLRRFASSGTSSHGGTESRDHTGPGTGSGTRAGTAGNSTSFGTPEGAATLIKWAVAGIIIVIGGLLAMNIISHLRADDKNTESEDAPSEQIAEDPDNSESGDDPGDNTGDNVNNTETSTETAPNDGLSPTERKRIQQYSELRRLRERLDARPQDQVLRTIDQELIAIEDDPADQTISDICVELRDDLDRLIGQRLAVAEADRLRTLRGEVTQLIAKHEYDAALERLNGFTVQSNQEIQGQIDSMIQAVNLNRDSFMTTLKSRIERAIGQDDATTLRRIRDEDLPPSLAEGEYADRINEALRNLDQATLTEHRAYISSMSVTLSNWDFNAYQDLRDDYHDLLSTGPDAQSYEDLDNLATSATAFFDELTLAIDQADRAPRYSGLLAGVYNGDIIDHDNGALIVRPRDGGVAKVLLRNLNAQTIQGITELVLGEEALQAYAPVIDGVIALNN